MVSEMENISITDIIWNLKSSFQDTNFNEAELILIKREQKLKKEKLEMESKYNAVIKENDALKKQCDKLRRESMVKFHVKKSDDGNVQAPGSREGFDRLTEKIRSLERENATLRAKSGMAERGEIKASEENAKHLYTIRDMEEEKGELERTHRVMRCATDKKIVCLEKEIATLRERACRVEVERRGLMKGEIEKHLEKISCLETEIAVIREREMQTKEENVRVSDMIVVIEEERGEALKRVKEVRGNSEKYLLKIGCLEKEIATFRERAEVAERRETDVSKENARVLGKVKAMEVEKEEALRRERELRVHVKSNLQKIGCLEKEIITIRGRADMAEKRETNAGEENTRLLDMLMAMEKEKEEAEKEVRVDFEKHMQNTGYLEKEIATVRERVEMAERREIDAREENTEVLDTIKAMKEEKEESERRYEEMRGEIKKHLQKIKCLEKEKESALAKSGSFNQIVTRIKKRIDILTEEPGLNLSSVKARLSLAYDADVEDRLDTNITEKSEGQKSSHSSPLSVQNTNLSPMLSGKHRTTPVILIGDSDSDDEGVKPRNAVKRKRNSSGSSSTKVVDNENDENISRKHKSEVFKDLAYGFHQFSSPVASRNETNASGSRSTTTIKCSDKEIRAVASWEFEADMLNAFDKHPVVAMEAVCALYRQQKSRGDTGIASLSGSAFSEKRGFFSLLAYRGTNLAEFLLDRDAPGGMKKSLEELKLHDPKGLDDCKKIASSHSKQLFEIYQKQEDPFFGPN